MVLSDRLRPSPPRAEQRGGAARIGAVGARAMLAVERAERSVDEAAEGEDERLPDSAADDGVLDGWIASLTADQFERVLASLARGQSRW